MELTEVDAVVILAVLAEVTLVVVDYNRVVQDGRRWILESGSGTIEVCILSERASC